MNRRDLFSLGLLALTNCTVGRIKSTDVPESALKEQVGPLPWVKIVKKQCLGSKDLKSENFEYEPGKIYAYEGPIDNPTKLNENYRLNDQLHRIRGNGEILEVYLDEIEQIQFVFSSPPPPRTQPVIEDLNVLQRLLNPHA